MNFASWIIGGMPRIGRITYTPFGFHSGAIWPQEPPVEP